MKFQIEQYEVHSQKYIVEADSLAEAVKKLYDEEADLVDITEYIEVNDDRGLPIEELSEEDLQGLRERGINFDGYLPSIRKITEI